MRIGIRGAISGLVLASIVVSAVGVHLLWWRTAEQTSQTLATTINEQIVSAVSDELQSITTEARSAHAAIRTLFQGSVLDPREVDKRKFTFLSQLQAQPTISWVAFGWPDGSLSAVHKLGDAAVEMLEIPKQTANSPSQARISRYELIDGDLRFKDTLSEATSYSVLKQEWFDEAMQSVGPRWFNLAGLPRGDRLAVTLAGPIDIDGKRQGVLSIIIELTRVSRFLSQLTVGKSAGAFILDRDGAAIASPDPDADEVNALKTDHPLFPVAVTAARQSARSYDPDQGEAFRTRVVQDDLAFEVVLTPISFPGWSLVTVVPESEFLGPVRTTIRRLLVGLAALIIAAGLFSAWFAQRLIAGPLIKVVGEIRHVERFDLEKVERHPSRLTEIENLSGAIGDMAQGLAAFRKYIPADLVRRLISDGGGARLGGAVRPMSVMFVDLAGFTGMSERMGDRIIPLLSRYFETVSLQVQRHGGTIDKFIGDAVMAFWGAPASDPDHAINCCRAALACQQAVRELALVDEEDRAVTIRIGINSGEMLVGNIGSEVRLNYTVIGDAVNIASRLEGTNKLYGSQIIIGPETRRLAGDRITVRELDRLAVYGRTGGLQIYELLGMAGEYADSSGWVAHYETGLASYRARDFAAAILDFEKVVTLRKMDLASSMMIERCREQLKMPAGDDWDDTTVALRK
ncbi:MAG: adenylate/guanylate cyclase domain-containing protein [Bradyrhizobium sp.]|nr:adenylate/guanylate cyclase domain-containing protein [Bradyrhizobium sp.]